ncbi:hypothetical protein COAQ111491_14120 [Comamonas aquatilis]|uniref:hypothetical protein n=1 Tax=Comamonas aquatilis TaxID=1778406 RepID=UPI0039EECEC2
MKFRSPGSQALHIALLSGHTLAIPPEGVDVPAEFRREAIAKGAEPMAIESIQESPAAMAALAVMLAQSAPAGGASAGSAGALDDAAAAAAAAEKRKAMIKDALKAMLAGNNEADFTADGKPNLNSLKKVAGFNVARGETDDAWAELQAELDDEEAGQQ